MAAAAGHPPDASQSQDDSILRMMKPVLKTLRRAAKPKATKRAVLLLQSVMRSGDFVATGSSRNCSRAVKVLERTESAPVDSSASAAIEQVR